ncbi:MAG TPA: phosphate ABC transporter substrate-binding protein PstS [bacterium]|nr:phosphate ABC transporter substrate-binding protein PstS [bacterium]HOM26691.1 phosphate ABC transporter substrate-binding protein PstS [bacterium]
MIKKIFLGLVMLFVGIAKVESQTELVGAGATFPYPLYSKMFDEYYKIYGVKINYQSIGSGGGIRQLKAKTVDFAGSDAILSDEQLKDFDDEILHIPTCLGAVVITYNLPVEKELKFTPDIISDIYLGKITKWNDDKIKKVNSNVNLPDMPIIVVRRSDGSGTTFVFTDYLSKVSEEWKTKVGRGTSVNWPVGIGGKGNEGVSGIVKGTPGAIGYVELTYALQNNLPFGIIKNKSGNFVKPSIESITFASDIKLPDDMRVSITDTENKNGYPISAFTYILVYKNLKNANEKMSYEKAENLVKLLWWMTHEGQKYTKPLNYAPLGKEAVKKAENLLKKLHYDSKILIK